MKFLRTICDACFRYKYALFRTSYLHFWNFTL